jgi:hypothetical protein
LERQMEFLKRYKEQIVVSVVLLYVTVLAIGVFAEFFNIRSVLQWPIYLFR